MFKVVWNCIPQRFLLILHSGLHFEDDKSYLLVIAQQKGHGGS